MQGEGGPYACRVGEGGCATGAGLSILKEGRGGMLFGVSGLLLLLLLKEGRRGEGALSGANVYTGTEGSTPWHHLSPPPLQGGIVSVPAPPPTPCQQVPPSLMDPPLPPPLPTGPHCECA